MVASQILTGLVVLVVDIDFAHFVSAGLSPPQESIPPEIFCQRKEAVGSSFFRRKGQQKAPCPFFFWSKKKVVEEKTAASQILTGLVVLVVDIDSALFRLDVLLRVW